MDTISAPPVQKEIRFAVVMYGGVSLAIYINGVVQELFKMVRATARKEDGSYLIPAPDPNTPQPGAQEVLGATELIYREIGEKLQAKFVVDILSGTSAGGINAVYLAKALANDQSLDELKTIWVKEGDIGLLINDGTSTQGLPKNLAKILNQKPRSSLLNSHRMYFKLLYALDQMDGKTAAPASPYVDNLDLFVTATDLQGLNSTLQISQQKVYELRYRNVFHFTYSADDLRNDFRRPVNPFLAFAARCTSSFPFAFEPMELSDVADILNSAAFYNIYKYEPDKWKSFFEPYVKIANPFSMDVTAQQAAVTDAIRRFEQRPFGDGGYLDNKPFSFATRAILERESTIPVDRKMLYIEPSPEHPEQDGLKNERPDAFSNVLSALLTLPRYETIREDLQLLSEHNRVVRRLRGTTELAMNAIFQNKRATEFWRKSSGRNKAWQSKSLKEMIKQYGEVYGVYHQLRVTQVTDDLASLVAGRVGCEEESEVWKNIRTNLKKWREQTFFPDPVEDQLPENEFLHKFDIGWRVRRLRFLLYLLDRLFDTPDRADAGTQINAATIFKQARIGEFPRIDLDEYRAALQKIKKEIHQTLSTLKSSVQNAPIDNFVHVMETNGDPKEAMTNLLYHMQDALREARISTEKLLTQEQQSQSANSNHAYAMIQTSLRHFFDLFEYFDLMTFPIQYGTPMGEADEVDIWRVSPEDATSLVDERGSNRKKLMGTKFGNFGGFFNEEWRVRDILWGRLDGAERIITALLSGTDYEQETATMIRKANVAVLKEELLRDFHQASKPLAATLQKVTATIKRDQSVVQSQGTQEAESFDSIVLKMGPDTLRAILRNNIQDDELLEIFKQSQEEEESLKPETALTVASRATQVMAGIVDDLPFQVALKNKTVWLYRLGRIVSTLVQLATPDSSLHGIFRKTVGVVYLAALLIVIFGRFINPDLVGFGWEVLGITAVVHLAVITLTDYLRARKTYRFLITVLGSLLIAFLLLLAFIGITHFNQDVAAPIQKFFGTLFVR